MKHNTNIDAKQNANVGPIDGYRHHLTMDRRVKLASSFKFAGIVLTENLSVGPTTNSGNKSDTRRISQVRTVYTHACICIDVPSYRFFSDYRSLSRFRLVQE